MIDIPSKSNMRHKVCCKFFKGKLGGPLVSIGWNYRYTSNVVIANPKCMVYNSFSIHAEIAALYKFLHQYKECRNIVVLVERYNKQGELLLARPCVRCYNMLRKYPFKGIYYSNENGIVTFDDRYIQELDR